MPTSTGYLKSTLDILLPLDVGEVVGENALCLGKLGTGIHDSRVKANFAVEELHHLNDIVHAIDVEVVDHGGLEGIGSWNDETVQLQLSRKDCHGQGALDRSQAAVEREFTHEHEALQLVRIDFLVGCEDAHCQR